MHIWMSYPLFTNLNSKPISRISSWKLGDSLTTLTKSIWHNEAVLVPGKAVNGLGASLQFAESQLHVKVWLYQENQAWGAWAPARRLWRLRRLEERRNVNQETKQPGNRSQPQGLPLAPHPSRTIHSASPSPWWQNLNKIESLFLASKLWGNQCGSNK